MALYHLHLEITRYKVRITEVYLFLKQMTLEFSWLSYRLQIKTIMDHIFQRYFTLEVKAFFCLNSCTQ